MKLVFQKNINPANAIPVKVSIICVALTNMLPIFICFSTRSLIIWPAFVFSFSSFDKFLSFLTLLKFLLKATNFPEEILA